MQSGDFDAEILCAEHEASLHAPDDYAVRLIREWRELARSPVPDFFVVDTIDHAKLLRFVAAVVWRHGASSRYGKVTLGPFEPALRNYVFDGDQRAFRPEVFVHAFYDDRFSRETLDGMLLPVSRGELVGRRAWGFTVRGLHFLMKMDSRPLTVLDRRLLLGETPDLVVVNKALRGSSEERQMISILQNMVAARKR